MISLPVPVAITSSFAAEAQLTTPLRAAQRTQITSACDGRHNWENQGGPLAASRFRRHHLRRRRTAERQYEVECKYGYGGQLDHRRDRQDVPRPAGVTP